MPNINAINLPLIAPLIARQTVSAALLQAGAQSPLQAGQQARVDGGGMLARAMNEFQGRAQQLATQEPVKFAAVLDKAFGGKLSAGERAAIVDAARNGTLNLPAKTLLIGSTALGSALAAYAAANGGTIFLSQLLLGDNAALRMVMGQALGLHFSSLLGAGGNDLARSGQMFAQTIAAGTVGLSNEQPARTDSNMAIGRASVIADGIRHDAILVPPNVTLWLGASGAAALPTGVIHGALVAQLSGAKMQRGGNPTEQQDRSSDPQAALLPNRLNAIRDLIEQILRDAALSRKILRNREGRAAAVEQSVRWHWSLFERQAVAGAVGQATASWAALVQRVRLVQVGAAIVERGGRLDDLAFTIRLPTGHRHFDLAYHDGGALKVGDVVTEWNHSLADMGISVRQAHAATAMQAEYCLHADDARTAGAAALGRNRITMVDNIALLRARTLALA
ncbi:MAG: hypothetical protein U5J78_01325 [Parasphingorhabdus sp.]|nr:hypothetical protein [Parasphingorhabdus sp.]